MASGRAKQEEEKSGSSSWVGRQKRQQDATTPQLSQPTVSKFKSVISQVPITSAIILVASIKFNCQSISGRRAPLAFLGCGPATRRHRQSHHVRDSLPGIIARGESLDYRQTRLLKKELIEPTQHHNNSIITAHHHYSDTTTNIMLCF